MSGLDIPDASMSEELLQHLGEIQCSVQTVQNKHLASWSESRDSCPVSDKQCLLVCSDEETENDKASDRLDKMTLVLAALQIENTKLWSRLEELHREVNALRNENNKLRDDLKSQWDELHHVRCNQ